MKNKIIYIKYSELTLKKKNRMDFIRILLNNVKWALQNFNLKIQYFYDYMSIVDFNEQNIDEILAILKEIPGINSFYVAYLIDKNLDNLVELSLSIIQNEINKNNNLKSFRITSRRQDKNFTSSLEIINLVAGVILSKTSLNVDLYKADLNLQIEVKKDNIVVFVNGNNGSNGLPVGSSGRALVLLSGGIDSPVAARLLMLRGLKVDFITFITPPHTSEKALDKVRNLAKLITLNNKLCKSKLFICNFSDIQHELTHIKKESYRITLMRRQFFKIAKTIAMQNNTMVLATGESLGQVASQTIESMTTISQVLDNFLILRPLVSYDKEQIISLAKKFNTYETSILPYDDSCSLFAPKNPVTKPNIETALELENDCFLLDSIVENVIKNKVTKEDI